MKTVLFAAFALVLGSFSASAQTKAKLKTTFQTPTVQCEMCKNKILTYLNRYDGIESASVNLKKKEVSVIYYTDRINTEEIKAAIANAGYDAGDKDGNVAASEDAYKRLPKCCKKPEDGGGMKKN